MIDVLEQAKQQLDAELDMAVEIGLKRWQRHIDRHELKELEIPDNSAMLAFMLSSEAVKSVSNTSNSFPEGSEITKGDNLHITLKYFPELNSDDLRKLRSALKDYSPIDSGFDGKVKVTEVDVFEKVNDGKDDAVILRVQPTKLRKFRNHLLGFLEDYGIELPQDTHPQYTPHITLAYVPVGSGTGDVKNTEFDLQLGTLSLVQQDDELVTIVLPVTVEKQLPINDDSKKVLLQVRTDIYNEASDSLAEQVFNGDISIGQWQDEMKKLVKGLNTSTAAIAKGGWDLMGPRDWGRLGTPNREQYKFLRGFAQDLSDNRDQITLAYIKNRARLYGEAAGGVASKIEAGFWFEDNLPYLPRDGSTECLMRCHCRWVLNVIENRDTFQVVEAVWDLGEADHCDTCVSRDGHVEIVRVPLDVDVPSQIGGY